MASMFREAKKFDCDLSEWDVSSVTEMVDMFLNAASFNQRLCGMAWLRSRASKQGIFEGSSGSISESACTSTLSPVSNQASQQLSRDARPDRELIVRMATSTSASTPLIISNLEMVCSRCGAFRKSGRASCCAPGGAWFRKCGGPGSSNVDHSWSEGAKTCERTCYD